MADHQQPPGRLDFKKAVSVWKMRRAGWVQHRIAATLDVNQGRISEVLSGKRFAGSREAAEKGGAIDA
jgi:predicted XRE-type DNA-binding protein